MLNERVPKIRVSCQVEYTGSFCKVFRFIETGHIAKDENGYRSGHVSDHTIGLGGPNKFSYLWPPPLVNFYYRAI